MPAAKKFLINAFVAGTAIPSGQMRADGEAVVIHLLLGRTGLVAVEAIDALLRVGGHLVFMDDRVLKPCMTLGALSRRPDEVGRGLSRLDARTLPIDKERGQNERKCNNNSQKYRTKRHGAAPGGMALSAALEADICVQDGTMATVSALGDGLHQSNADSKRIPPKKYVK